MKQKLYAQSLSISILPISILEKLLSSILTPIAPHTAAINVPQNKKWPNTVCVVLKGVYKQKDYCYTN